MKSNKGQFKKCLKPWNFGKKGLKRKRKKTGITAVNNKPINSERMHMGYIQIKTGNSPSIWKMKHIIIWESINGKISSSNILIFKDGNKLNCSIDNLELMSRGVRVRLNNYEYEKVSKEIKPSIKILAEVEQKAFEL
jgi:hypothetical protein